MKNKLKSISHGLIIVGYDSIVENQLKIFYDCFGHFQKVIVSNVQQIKDLWGQKNQKYIIDIDDLLFNERKSEYCIFEHPLKRYSDILVPIIYYNTVIIPLQTYKSPMSSMGISIVGGLTPIYMSDYCFIISKKDQYSINVSIVKDKGSFFTDFSIVSRQKLLKSKLERILKNDFFNS